MTWQRIHSLWISLHAKRWFRLLINAAFILAFMFFLMYYVRRDWQQTFSKGIQFDMAATLKAVGLYGINYILFMVAWQELVTWFGGVSDWKQNALVYSYSYVARFLPTPAWYLASRVYLSERTGVGKRVALVMTAVETVLHALTGLALYGVLMIAPSNPVTWLYALAAIPPLLILYRPTWLHQPWLVGAQAQIAISRRSVARLLALYLLTWLVSAPFFFFTIRAIGQPIQMPTVDLWRIWTMSSLVAYIGTYTLGGIAILREFTLAWFLNSFYMPAIGILITIASRLLMTGAGLFWALSTSGILALAVRLRKGRPTNQDQRGVVS